MKYSYPKSIIAVFNTLQCITNCLHSTVLDIYSTSYYDLATARVLDHYTHISA